MLEFVIQAFATLFVIVDPLGVVAIYLSMTAGADPAWRKRMAWRGVLIGGTILVIFAFVGEALLSAIGIGLPAFRIAGGAMLFMIAIEMVFEKRAERRRKNMHPPESDDGQEEHFHEPADISVFPLAIPLISGPGAITAILLLVGSHPGSMVHLGLVLGVLAFVLSLTLAGFLMAETLERVMGETITTIIARLLGVLLAALAVEFIMSGIFDAWKQYGAVISGT